MNDSIYRDFFNYMFAQHRLILTDSEIDDIVAHVVKFHESQIPTSPAPLSLCPDANGKEIGTGQAAAIDIVKKISHWCKRYPESSTSPMAGLKQFREIERAANDLVSALPSGKNP